MQIDFTKLQPGQIALITAVATLVAATMAGVFALVVALVNGWMARRMARVNAHRDYRLELFRPYTTVLNDEVRVTRDILTRLVSISSESVDEALATVERLVQREHSTRVWNVWTPNGLSAGSKRNASLRNAMARFNVASNELDDFLIEITRFLKSQRIGVNWFTIDDAHPLRTRYIEALKSLVVAGFEVKHELERFLFR